MTRSALLTVVKKPGGWAESALKSSMIEFSTRFEDRGPPVTKNCLRIEYLKPFASTQNLDIYHKYFHSQALYSYSSLDLDLLLALSLALSLAIVIAMKTALWL